MSKQYKSALIILYLLGGLAVLLLSFINPIIVIIALGAAAFIYIFFKFINNKWGLFHYLGFMAILISISPIITLPGLPWGFRLDDFWLIFGAVVLLFKLVVNKDVHIKFPSYAKIYLIFIIWITVTILFSSFREPNLYSHRDWTEIYNNGKMLLVLLLAINVKLDDIKLKKMIDFILIGLFGAAMMGVFQYFNFLNINNWLTPIYVSESNYESLIYVRRVVGTFANPNTFGAAMLIGVAISFARLLYKFNIKYATLLVLFLTALTLSLSRTTLVLSILAMALILVGVLFKTKRKVSAILMIIFSPVLVILVSSLAPDRFFSRFSQLEDLSTTGSWTVRLANWQNIFESRTTNNLITGTGPTSNLPITFDNEWLMLLTHYGIIGVMLFLAIFITIYFKINNTYGFYGIAMRSMMLSLIGCMVFLPVYGALQLMPLIMLAIGLGLNKIENEEEVTEAVKLRSKKRKRFKRYKIVW